MANPTLIDIIPSMSFGVRWTTPSITFSIPTVGSTWPAYTGGEPSSAGYRPLTASEADVFRAEIAAWASVIGVQIVETNDFSNPGQIRVGIATLTGPESGHAYTPALDGAAGDVWLSVNSVPFLSNGGLMLHELGHALGLKHPFDPVTILPIAFQTQRYSVMGNLITDQIVYTFGPAGGSTAQVLPEGPMVYDIAAIQEKYGINKFAAAGDTTYTFTSGKAFLKTINDASGRDTIDLSGHLRPSQVDLRPGAYSSIDIYPLAQQIAELQSKYPAYASVLPGYFASFPAGVLHEWRDNLGISYSTVIEDVLGGAGGDTIVGNAAGNQFAGAGGNDTLDGGDGTDTAIYSGSSANYSWTRAVDGSWSVQDLRAGSPDGTDTLRSIEILRFSDKSVTLGTAVTATLATAFANILRLSAPAGAALALETDLEAKVAAGTLTIDQAVSQIVNAATATTSVATLAYEFFTGTIPSQAGIEYLISPTGPNSNNLNSTYYQSFNIENRYINFAVNLGKLGDGKAAFEAGYGGKSLLDTVKTAYATIFGSSPSDAKAHALLDPRADYFAAYGLDGPNGIGTKAAAVGWLLAEAAKADIGMYAKANDAFLTDLVDGAIFSIDLVGLYGRPEYNFISI